MVLEISLLQTIAEWMGWLRRYGSFLHGSLCHADLEKIGTLLSQDRQIVVALFTVLFGCIGFICFVILGGVLIGEALATAIHMLFGVGGPVFQKCCCI
jgi:hypothetical protein